MEDKVVTDEDRTETEIYSRVVGYITPVKRWNDGKAAEYKDRTVFEVDNDKSRKVGIGAKRVKQESDGKTIFPKESEPTTEG